MTKLDSIPFEGKYHIPLLEGWFADHGQEVPPWDLMPPTGLVIIYDGKPVCAGFLTKTDANLAIHTNYVSDKYSAKALRSMCLDHLCECLDKIAASEGFKMICASTAHPSMAKRYEAMGYVTTHEKFINLGRFLCG